MGNNTRDQKRDRQPGQGSSVLFASEGCPVQATLRQKLQELRDKRHTGRFTLEVDLRNGGVGQVRTLTSENIVLR